MSEKEVPVAPLEEQADDILADADQDELAAEADEIIARARKKPPAVLSGSGTVRLLSEVTDVYTPEDAVESFLGDILRNGFNSLVFVVTDDETGNLFYVHDGEVVDIRTDSEGGYEIVDYYADDEADEDDDEADEGDDEDDGGE